MDENILLSVDRSKSLYHHGVQGQKWGVRNGPPYPIETGMKAHTKINSVSIEKNTKKYLKNKRYKYTYDPNDEWDSMVYKGPFSKYISADGFYKVFEHKFETIKDLKMPTKKERQDIFKSVLESDKELYFTEFLNMYKTIYNMQEQYSLSEHNKKLVDNFYDALKKSIYGTTSFENAKIKDVDKDKFFKEIDDDTLYGLFGHMAENISTSDFAKNYYNELSKNYDAAVDDNNQGVYNDAHDPVIIFKPSEVLRIVDKSQEVPYVEILSRTNIARQVLNANGKRLSL